MTDYSEGSVPRDFEQVLDQLGSPVFNQLSEFDNARNSFYDNLAIISATMREATDSDDVTNIDVNPSVEAFRTLVKAVLGSSMQYEAKIEVLTNIFKNDSDERVGMMNGLIVCENECIQQYAKEHLNAIIQDLMGDEDPVDAITDYYGTDMNSDVGLYLSHLQGQHVHEDEDDDDDGVQVIEVKKDVRDHAIDFAKMTAAAFLAIGIERMLRGRGK